MAKGFKAVTAIRYGKSGENGNVVTEFAPGDLVTGLSKDEMKALWDAGALEMTTTAEATPSEKVAEDVNPDKIAEGGNG